MREQDNWFDQERAWEGRPPSPPPQAGANWQAPPPSPQATSEPEKEKSGGTMGCSLLVLYFLLIIVSIALMAFWEWPVYDDLGYALWMFGGISWIIGLIFGPLGWWLYSSEKTSTEGCNTPVVATITDIVVEEHTNANARGTYHAHFPVYTYQLNGETISVKSRRYSIDKDHYQIGQQVQIKVAPGEPGKYYIEADSAVTMKIGKIMSFGIPMAVVGLAMCLIGALILLVFGQPY